MAAAQGEENAGLAPHTVDFEGKTQEAGGAGKQSAATTLLFGIDLGGHTSAVAAGNRNAIMRILSGEGDINIKKVYAPSTILFKDRLIMYGAEAEARISIEPKNTLTNLPLWLTVHDVQTARALEERIGFCPYPHLTLERGKLFFRVRFSEHEMQIPFPVALGLFMQHLRVIGNPLLSSRREVALSNNVHMCSHDADALQLPVDACVVVPSAATRRSCSALSAAAAVGGLQLTVLRRIDALINCWACERLPRAYEELVQLQRTLNVKPLWNGAVHLVVIDFSFAETSIAVLEIRKPIDAEEVEQQPQQEVLCKVVARRVDPYLGFADVISRVARHVAVHVEKRYNAVIRTHSRGSWRLHMACVRAIQELYDVEETVIDLNDFVLDDTDLCLELTRKHFADICRPLEEKLEGFFEETFYQANLSPTQILTAEMSTVAGAARMPWLTQRVEKFFGDTHAKDSLIQSRVRKELQTESAAALGAAYFSAGKHYVSSLQKKSDEYDYSELEINHFRQLAEDMLHVEASELRLRSLKNRLELCMYQTRQLIYGTEEPAEAAEREGKRLLREAEIMLTHADEACSAETVENKYNELRSFAARHFPRGGRSNSNSSAAEELASRRDRSGVDDDEKKSTASCSWTSSNSSSSSVHQLLHKLQKSEGSEVIVTDAALGRAQKNIREATLLNDGGEYELASILCKKAIDTLEKVGASYMETAQKRLYEKVKADVYVELAKAETGQAEKNHALEKRSELLAAAVKHCDTALQIKTDIPRAFQYRSKAFFLLGDYEQALEDVVAGLSLNHEDRHMLALKVAISSRMKETSPK